MKRQSRLCRASSGVSRGLIQKRMSWMSCKRRTREWRFPNIRKSSFSGAWRSPASWMRCGSVAQELNSQLAGERFSGFGFDQSWCLQSVVDVWMRLEDEKIL